MTIQTRRQFAYGPHENHNFEVVEIIEGSIERVVATVEDESDANLITLALNSYEPASDYGSDE